VQQLDLLVDLEEASAMEEYLSWMAVVTEVASMAGCSRWWFWQLRTNFWRQLPVLFD
jgi:hypothetical protein